MADAGMDVANEVKHNISRLIDLQAAASITNR
jgi:hypothetical protein